MLKPAVFLDRDDTINRNADLPREAWGRHTTGDLHDAVTTAVINKRASGMGLISGRKAFQRPMNEGPALLHAIQDVYLDENVTIA